MKTKTMLIATLLIAGASFAQEEIQGGNQPEGPQKPNPDTIFNRLDTDGNGVIDKAEFMAGHQKRMQHFREQQCPEYGMKSRPEGARPDGMGPKGTGLKRMSPDEVVKKFDADADGKLSSAELETMFKAHHPRKLQGEGE